MALNYYTIGMRIKGYRLQREISQEELASVIQSSSKYISRIETAVRRPSLESLVKISNALQVSPNDLLLDNFVTQSPAPSSALLELLKDCNAAELSVMQRAVQFLKDILRR